MSSVHQELCWARGSWLGSKSCYDCRLEQCVGMTLYRFGVEEELACYSRHTNDHGHEAVEWLGAVEVNESQPPL